MNLAGVKRIMQMQAELERMRRRVEELERQLSRRPIVAPGRVGGAQIVPLRTLPRFPWEVSRS